MKLRQGKTTL